MLSKVYIFIPKKLCCAKISQIMAQIFFLVQLFYFDGIAHDSGLSVSVGFEVSNGKQLLSSTAKQQKSSVVVCLCATPLLPMGSHQLRSLPWQDGHCTSISAHTCANTNTNMQTHAHTRKHTHIENTNGHTHTHRKKTCTHKCFLKC